MKQDVQVTLRVVGRAEAYESVSLKSRIDGQVAEVLFTEGQRVKAGDALIRLDPIDYAERLQQTEATVSRDEALLAKAQADTACYIALKDRNFVSAEKVNGKPYERSRSLGQLASEQSCSASVTPATFLHHHSSSVLRHCRCTTGLSWLIDQDQ